jgi:hypothetical protein
MTIGVDDLVKIETSINSKGVYKDFHIDCFNILFSTDINKIKEVI